ncbi:hypothetical protein K431DRAFT_13439 [Polychaeton citri CBS 116435]|uniref:Uncharacterized protein n=1 Tax=Polychaeton citri CBS 116435 TaxID=1314669 RepID=A0A9P4UK97_9PEZI|nr:hypothetical protein K431DRAFT_13439 [Polychaeton citri CBS 116435]
MGEWVEREREILWFLQLLQHRVGWVGSLTLVCYCITVGIWLLLLSMPSKWERPEASPSDNVAYRQTEREREVFHMRESSPSRHWATTWQLSEAESLLCIGCWSGGGDGDGVVVMLMLRACMYTALLTRRGIEVPMTRAIVARLLWITLPLLKTNWLFWCFPFDRQPPKRACTWPRHQYGNGPRKWFAQ